MGFFREGLLASSPAFFSSEKYISKYTWMVDGRWWMDDSVKQIQTIYGNTGCLIFQARPSAIYHPRNRVISNRRLPDCCLLLNWKANNLAGGAGVMQLVLKRNWNCLPVFLTDVGFYNAFQYRISFRWPRIRNGDKCWTINAGFLRDWIGFSGQGRFLRIRFGFSGSGQVGWFFRIGTGGLQDRDWISGLGLFKG